MGRTLRVKGASEALAAPSLTLITILLELPTLAVFGVPASVPVLVLKLAHDGLPDIENLRVYPLGPFAVGVKRYACQPRTEVRGVPEMVGGIVLATAAWHARSAAIAQPAMANRRERAKRSSLETCIRIPRRWC